MQTRYGYQPLRDVLKRHDITQIQAAKDLGVPFRHLRNVIIGRTFPMDILKEKLPVYLGVPLQELFTPAVLAHTYQPNRLRKDKRNDRAAG